MTVSAADEGAPPAGTDNAQPATGTPAAASGRGQATGAGRHGRRGGAARGPAGTASGGPDDTTGPVKPDPERHEVGTAGDGAGPLRRTAREVSCLAGGRCEAGDNEESGTGTLVNGAADRAVEATGPRSPVRRKAGRASRRSVMIGLMSADDSAQVPQLRMSSASRPLGAARHRARVEHGAARLDGRQRRAADDRPAPERLAGRTAVDGHGLHPHARRAHPARRVTRRPASAGAASSSSASCGSRWPRRSAGSLPASACSLARGCSRASAVPCSLPARSPSFRPRFAAEDRPRAVGAWSGLGGVASAIGPLSAAGWSR